jgi:hypothetical protein
MAALHDFLTEGTPVEKIAEYLCRAVEAKIIELRN